MPAAKQRLKDIKKFAQGISDAYAKRIIQQLREKASQLKDNNFDGRPIPELNDKNVRQLLIGQYRIIYRIISDSEAHILTFWHSSKPLNPDQDIEFEYED